MTTPTIVANLRHAARNHETVTIGGGQFGPDELRDAADRIEAGHCDYHLPPAISQLQRDTAVRHLHALLNAQRTATQAWEAEREARQWLESIGSEAP